MIHKGPSSVHTISPEALTHQLQWRYAVKRFDPDKKIEPTVWRALESSLVLAPSSYGLQPWYFYVITDSAIKAQLPALSWNQTQPRDCSHMVVLAARSSLDEHYIDHYLNSIIQHRGVSRESLAGFRKLLLQSIAESAGKHFDWNAKQIYIALGQLMASAAMLGVDACPMEGIDAAAYDRLLGLADTDYSTVVGCALGYRHASDKYAELPKVRFGHHEVIKHVSEK